MAEQQPVIIDDQMAIGRGNVYVPRSQGVVIVSENRGQRAGSVKNLIENRTALTWQMYCDKNCRGEIAGKIFCKKRQRFDAARRRADGHNVSIGHNKLSLVIPAITSLALRRFHNGIPFAVGKTLCGRYDRNISIFGNTMASVIDSDGAFAQSDEPVFVAMGASAGGVRALQTFFGSIPPDTGAAYVVIVHLDPERRSELASIIGARTKMPVVQVLERQKIETNRVY